MKSNLPQHPCKGKCTAFDEERCGTCLILDPTCDYCGSDQLVVKSQSTDCFICIDCVDDLEPVALFITGDINEHLARAVIAQGEIS